jgi:hypothetical protein
MRSVIGLLLLIVTAASGFGQTAANENLRKAIVEEEVKKDLPAAIKLYSGVIQAFDRDRKALAPPKTEAADAPRKKYRDLLVLQMEYATKDNQAVQRKYELGMAQQIDVLRSNNAISEAELRLAAFDAGFGTAAGPISGGTFGSRDARLVAATALFRMAECYRKQGKAEQANAAYARVVSEFPEQADLAAQSRAKVPASYQIPLTPQQLALQTVRLGLVRHANFARANRDFVQKQLSLGAVSDIDTYASQSALAAAESRLAAWDAGDFELALRPVNLAVAPSGQSSEMENRLGQLQAQLASAQRQLQTREAEQLKQELKKLQAQMDAISRTDAQRLEQQVKELQEQIDEMRKAAPKK